MKTNELTEVLKKQNINVRRLSIEMSKAGCPLSYSTIYKKLRGERQFKAREIKVISDILKLSEEQTMRIFFNEMVS
ncbi:BetR domain protein [Listeria ilorinensis]|uniref:BetR domain protein n=1 Tax=Listeria ilorinensis TaxID=2867439 RepID=UPI001EF73505|nr:BetR domain protein [Listeria ilorinensis]